MAAATQATPAADAPLDLRRHLDILRRSWWFILLVLGIALAATFVLTDRQTRIYESSAVVQLRSPQTETLFPFETTAPFQLDRSGGSELLYANSDEFRSVVRPQTPRGTRVSVTTRGEDLVFIGRGPAPEAVAGAANLWAEAYIVERQADFEASVETDIAFLEASILEVEQQRAAIRSEVIELEELLRDAEDSDEFERLRAEKDAVEAVLQPQLAPLDRQIADFGRELASLDSLTRFFGDPNVSARISGTASVPGSPSSPNLMRNMALGGLLGLTLGVATPYIRELLRVRVLDRTEVAETAELPVLATIPVYEPPDSTSIEVLDRPHSLASAHYQALLTAMEFAAIGESYRSVVFTSSAPADGKTTTALNVAALAAQYQNVLLIDADMRRPNVHQRIGLPNERGLAELLAGEATLSEVRQVLHRDGVRLDVITAGTPSSDPALLLRGPKWRKLVTDLFLYELIIVDSPPVLAVTDALLLGRETDAQILLTRSGVTEKSELVEAVDLVTSNGSRTLGLVLNHESEKKTRYSYYGAYEKSPR